MELLSISRALGLAEEGKRIISFYGAGGKTTLLTRLARELSARGRRVVITTTTKMHRPQPMRGVYTTDLNQGLKEIEANFCQENTVWFGSALLPGEKFKGIPPDWVEEVASSGADYILVEADGAAGRPIKGYASHEPVIPCSSQLLLPVLGLDALGGVLGAGLVHRPEHLCTLLQKKEGARFTPEDLARTLHFMLNLGKKQAPRARRVPILNKVDMLPETGLITTLLRSMACHPGGFPADSLLCTQANRENPAPFLFSLKKGAFRPYISCVLLASGDASRMGRDKLSLPLKGETLLEKTLSHILPSQAQEIIVVGKPGSGPLPCGGNRVRMVENPQHQEGISSSLKAGLRAVNPACQGVIFALGDMPFVPTEVYDALIGQYSTHLKAVTYPVYKGRRGKPVLFDRRLWPSLMRLTGDCGGRQVMDNLAADVRQEVQTGFPEVLLDIDTPADYRRYRDKT